MIEALKRVKESVSSGLCILHCVGWRILDCKCHELCNLRFHEGKAGVVHHVTGFMAE